MTNRVNCTWLKHTHCYPMQTRFRVNSLQHHESQYQSLQLVLCWVHSQYLQQTCCAGHSVAWIQIVSLHHWLIALDNICLVVEQYIPVDPKPNPWSCPSSRINTVPSFDLILGTTLNARSCFSLVSTNE